MTKISSGMTFFHKRIFPALWFGFLALFVATGLASGAVQRSWMFLVVPIFMAVFGYFLFKRLAWVLADEVHDCGDFLFVKSGTVEERVYLSNIMNVSVTTFANPPLVTLRLVTPVQSGSEITFSPAAGFTLNPFAKNKIAEDLMVRAHRARTLRSD